MLLALVCFHCHACSNDEDCNLNGVCASGSCSCDAAWTGGDCGVLNVQANSAHRLYPSHEDDVSSWGGLPVWDEESKMYHLFGSEFANSCSLGQWSPNSQVIRATSKTLFGPYQKQEVVLEPFHHNPTLTRASDGTWLLYVIGRHVEPDKLRNCSHSLPQQLSDPAPGNMESNITLFASRSVLGPWARVGVVLAGDGLLQWDADTTNPSALALPDGSVHLMYRGCGFKCSGGEYMGLAVATHWNCSVDVPSGCQYERQKKKLWQVTNEDPFLFRDRRGGWHSLFHNLGRNGGFGCNNKTWQGCDVGGHAFSRDGVAWTLSNTVPFTTNITWQGGAKATLNRRERPQLVMDKDGVTPLALVCGAQSGDVPASCNNGGTVASKECRSYTLAVGVSTVSTRSEIRISV